MRADRIYLDNNATAPLLPEAREAMMSWLTGSAGNPSSLHTEGQKARRALEEARESVAELLDAQPRQVIFTSGGTEANNLAIFGLLDQPHGHAITSMIEHPSVAACFDRLQDAGFNVERLAPSSDGIVVAESLEQRLRPETRLVSIMLANNETGALQPIKAMVRLARRLRVPFHTDAAQAVGKVPVSFRSLGVTALSLASHKFHGPTGVGALIVGDPSWLRPVLAGGHQEWALRPGTEPVSLAVGMAAALRTVCRDLEHRAARMASLRDRLESALCRRLPGVSVNGPGQHRIPNTTNLMFPGIDGQALVVALDLEGLACSTGSACASGTAEPSPVLLAMGLSRQEARSCLRFSLGCLTTDAEIDRAIDIVTRTVRRQLSMKQSTAGQGH